MNIKEKISGGISRRELIKPISAGLFGFAFLNLFKTSGSAKTENVTIPKDVSSDLPPIIIKSGSFTIESADSLTESGGGPYFYKKSGFGLIKAVRVTKVNEQNGMSETFYFADNAGIELDIRLQNYVSGNWQPLSESQLAQVMNETVSGSTNFVLKIAKNLDKKGKPKPNYKEKREDKGDEVFRFGSVVIRGKGTVPAPAIPITVDGDEYFIGLYNNPTTFSSK